MVTERTAGGRLSRRRLLVSIVAGGLTAACDAVWPSAPPAPGNPAAASPSPAGTSSPAPGQPVATSVQIVAAPSPLASPSPGAVTTPLVQSGLPMIVPGRVVSPSPGAVASPVGVASPGAGPGVRPGASPVMVGSPSPQPFPTTLRQPGWLVVQAAGRILLVDPARQQPPRTLVASLDGSWPLWSPDGRAVLYVSGLGPAAELRLAPVQGGSPRRLTANARPESGAAWAPRGDRLAYTLPATLGADGRIDPSVPEEVWLLDVVSGDTRKLVDGFDPCWSPDGRWIAYATNGQRDARGPRENAIRVISVDGADDRPLLAVSDLPSDLLPQHGLPFRPETLRLRAPDWSPTGLQLAASADGHTSLAWTFDERGQQLRPWALAYEGGVGRARWSPDGARLVVESRPATGVAMVIIVEPASRRETTLGGPSTGHQALTPAWAPDGRRLAVIAASLPARNNEPRQTALRLVGVDGADLGELLAEPDLQRPDWGAAP